MEPIGDRSAASSQCFLGERWVRIISLFNTEKQCTKSEISSDIKRENQQYFVLIYTIRFWIYSVWLVLS
jgi:hypothetical protein